MSTYFYAVNDARRRVLNYSGLTIKSEPFVAAMGRRAWPSEAVRVIDDAGGYDSDPATSYERWTPEAPWLATIVAEIDACPARGARPGEHCPCVSCDAARRAP